MSEAVERRIVALLDKPLICPHGNPIPGLAELGLPFATTDSAVGLITLTAAARLGEGQVVVDRISEQLQPDAALMGRFTGCGIRPGRALTTTMAGDGVDVWAAGADRVRFGTSVTDHVFVRLVGPDTVGADIAPAGVLTHAPVATVG